MMVCIRVASAAAAIALRRCAWRLAWRHTTGSRSSGEFMGGPTIRGKRAGQQLAARPAHHVARTLLLQHGVNPNAHDIYNDRTTHASFQGGTRSVTIRSRGVLLGPYTTPAARQKERQNYWQQKSVIHRRAWLQNRSPELSPPQLPPPPLREGFLVLFALLHCALV